MRRWPITAAIAGLALALAGVALASFTQHSMITLSASKAGQSSGIKALLYSTTNPAGQAPWAAKSLTVTFPSGTKFSLGSVKACTLSASQLSSGKSCPSASKIGSGSASAVPISNGKATGVVSGSANAYVAGSNKMVLVVKSTVGSLTKIVVIPETTSGDTLSIRVPGLKVTLGGSTFNVVLTKLQLTVPKHGTGRGALITAGKCTNDQFVVRTHFVYTNGKTKDIKSSSFCS
jgi:hypothetical protein